MTFKPDIPYNDLPLLPPTTDIETRKVLKKAIGANRALAELKGKALIIPNQEILINNITLQEARASSEIENVVTTNDSLFRALSSGTKTADPATKEVLNYREALWHGFDFVRGKGFLTTNLFIDIMQTIKKTGAGIRKPLPKTVLGDGTTGEIVYTPPEGEDVIRDKLKNLEFFLNDDNMSELDPIVKMAISHYQFEAIHPFGDGNGRTGRIINVLFLIGKGLLDLPILYLSSYIIANKSAYYLNLRNVTVKNDWESWVLYMLDAVEKTAFETIEKIQSIKDLMDLSIVKIKKELPGIYSKELVETLFEQPYCKVKSLVDKKIAERRTASLYLQRLEKIKILDGKKVGRENLYINSGLFELLKGRE